MENRFCYLETAICFNNKIKNVRVCHQGVSDSNRIFYCHRKCCVNSRQNRSHVVSHQSSSFSFRLTMLPLFGALKLASILVAFSLYCSKLPHSRSEVPFISHCAPFGYHSHSRICGQKADLPLFPFLRVTAQASHFDFVDRSIAIRFSSISRLERFFDLKKSKSIGDSKSTSGCAIHQ